jgi:hypothetical protein
VLLPVAQLLIEFGMRLASLHEIGLQTVRRGTAPPLVLTSDKRLAIERRLLIKRRRDILATSEIQPPGGERLA